MLCDMLDFAEATCCKLAVWCHTLSTPPFFVFLTKDLFWSMLSETMQQFMELNR